MRPAAIPTRLQRAPRPKLMARMYVSLFPLHQFQLFLLFSLLPHFIYLIFFFGVFRSDNLLQLVAVQIYT